MLLYKAYIHKKMYTTISDAEETLEDDDIEQSNKTKHCHWSRLKHIVSSHPNNNFILYHFSTRYTVREIELFFQVDGPNYLPNCHIWLNS